MWANLSRLGKKLRLQISVNYVEDDPSPSRYDKRGKPSATKRMLADQDAQLDAEDISGQPSIWGIDTDTTRFTSGTTRYVIPRSHNQFCQGSLPYITAATALLTT
jgi:hypothetical protein